LVPVGQSHSQKGCVGQSICQDHLMKEIPGFLRRAGRAISRRQFALGAGSLPVAAVTAGCVSTVSAAVVTDEAVLSMWADPFRRIVQASGLGPQVIRLAFSGSGLEAFSVSRGIVSVPATLATDASGSGQRAALIAEAIVRSRGDIVPGTLPTSTQRAELDELVLKLLCQAGYDPRDAARFWLDRVQTGVIPARFVNLGMRLFDLGYRF
jgi:hypothetical protein